ncbi:MAG: hypothetical protein ACQ9MH_14990 [Nitrospinales bacterium]
MTESVHSLKEDLDICRLTKGPAYHWFGYYDKSQFDSTQRYVLSMQVDFEHRRPQSDDTIIVGTIDLNDNYQWKELGESNAWCWQSGCMLQWRPGHNLEIMWNDRDNDHFITKILNIETGDLKILPFAFFCVHPDGKTALGLDFERLEYMRPGYGYAGVKDINDNVLAPADAGIYSLDLDSGKKELILSLADIAKTPHLTKSFKDCKHYFNCPLFNPTGSRFAFLHRWREDHGKGWPFRTRFMTADPDGKKVQVLVPGGCGHFNWKDPEHLLIQADGFSIYKDFFGKVGKIGENIIPGSGGHITYLPDKDWIVGDTYPDQDRFQKLYLYNIAEELLVWIGTFYSPLEYTGSQSDKVDNEWRCDLHPRISPDGNKIIIDSAHEGQGRQMYMIDISNVMNRY